MDAYTHGHHDSVLTSHRARTIANSAAYLEPYLASGLDLLDVGCGSGTITAEFGARVAPGVVVGIEPSGPVIDEARRTCQGQANVTIDVGDVYDLAYDDDAFDIVHAHQVLQHLSDPVGALREMKRVCRPGGIVAIRDADYEAMTWSPAMPELDEWLDLYRRVCWQNKADPDAGRSLLAWATSAGFDDVSASASVWCFATPESRSWWGNLWAGRVESSTLAEHAVAYGLAEPSDLERLAHGWRRWSVEPTGWFAVLHGEVICRVG